VEKRKRRIVQNRVSTDLAGMGEMKQIRYVSPAHVHFKVIDKNSLFNTLWGRFVLVVSMGRHTFGQSLHPLAEFGLYSRFSHTIQNHPEWCEKRICIQERAACQPSPEIIKNGEI
jgi:hypothetical protein